MRDVIRVRLENQTFDPDVLVELRKDRKKSLRSDLLHCDRRTTTLMSSCSSASLSRKAPESGLSFDRMLFTWCPGASLRQVIWEGSRCSRKETYNHSKHTSYHKICLKSVRNVIIFAGIKFLVPLSLFEFVHSFYFTIRVSLGAITIGV